MTGALIVAVAAVGFGLITMLVAYALVNGTLHREIRAARAGSYPPEIAYRRYITSSLGILRYAALIALIVPLVGVVVVIGNENVVVLLFGYLPAASEVGVIFGYVIGLFGALYAVPFGTYDLLTAPLGVHALAALRGIQLGGREALVHRLRRVLVVYAPVLVLCEVVSAAAFASVGLAVAVLVVGVIAVFILRRALATQLILWQTPSLPIQRTRWAALDPRIGAWGHLAGVRVKAVYVQQTARLGTGGIAAVGSRRARVLFIGDALLASTDWRQQDALIVHALNTSAAGIVLRSRLARLLVSYGILAAVVAIFAALLLISQNGLDVSPVVVIVLTLLAVMLTLGLFVYTVVMSIFARGRTRRRFLAADARAAAITGDPLALMVGLNTLSALSGAPTDRRLAYYPSTAERVAALDALLRQPGPRAPYAWQLVPSIVPVFVGPYCLTVPLAPTPQTAPVPVPAGPHPVVMPPASGQVPPPMLASPPAMMPGLPAVPFPPPTASAVMPAPSMPPAQSS